MTEKNYTINKKQMIRALDEKTREPMLAWRFFATSQGGTYFWLDVPDDQLEQAGELLAARAAKIDAIS
jgi:hypothetical protein